MQEARNLFEKKNVKIYSIGDEVTEPGVHISNNHCVVFLPKTQENEDFAKLLERQYYKAQERVIEQYKPKTDKRNIIYITFDTEFTHDDE